MRLLLIAALAVCVAPAGRAAAQPPPPPQPGLAPQAIRLFLDCPEGCDTTFLRSELTFLDHVNDREVADVHVLITELHTGGGGTEYTIALVGLKRFAGMQESLKYVSQPGDTDDDERRGILRVIKIGLVRYAAQTPLESRIQVDYRAPGEEDLEAIGQTTTDRWNFWVLRVRGDVDTEGEESTTSTNLDGSFSATRVTARWKSSVNLSLEYRRSRYSFEPEEGEEPEEDYISISRESSVGGLLVRSLGDHWGAGARVSMSSSTYTNHKRLFRVMPAIEYNVFPYAESTRRQLTFRYSLGAYRANYREITLYGRMEESLANHEFAVNWDMKQPWGTLDVQVEASQYLPDTHKNRLSIEADAEVRLFKGFSLDVGVNTSLIRDQVYLRAGRATPEEILLRQRQIATSYDYGFSVGFSYSFGSVYNNVVNSRLSNF